jgi:hypothetical protein
MKTHFLLIAMLVQALNAKDFTVVFENKSGQTLTFKIAVFKNSETPSDQDLFSGNNYSRFDDIFPGVETGQTKERLIRSYPDNGTVILVGVYAKGGRTNVIRRKLNQIRDRERIEIPFDYVSLKNPSQDFERFTQAMPETLYSEYAD